MIHPDDFMLPLPQNVDKQKHYEWMLWMTEQAGMPHRYETLTQALASYAADGVPVGAAVSVFGHSSIADGGNGLFVLRAADDALNPAGGALEPLRNVSPAMFGSGGAAAAAAASFAADKGRTLVIDRDYSGISEIAVSGDLRVRGAAFDAALRRSAGSVFIVGDGASLDIEGVTIKTEEDRASFIAAIDAQEGHSTLRVVNSKIGGPYGVLSTGPSSGSEIRSNQFSNFSIVAVQFQSAVSGGPERFAISDNIFKDPSGASANAASHPIRVTRRPSQLYQQPRDFSIDGNKIALAGVPFSFTGPGSADAIQIQGGFRYSITNNRVSGSGEIGITVGNFGASQFTVANNIVTGSDKNGIQCGGGGIGLFVDTVAGLAAGDEIPVGAFSHFATARGRILGIDAATNFLQLTLYSGTRPDPGTTFTVGGNTYTVTQYQPACFNGILAGNQSTANNIDGDGDGVALGGIFLQHAEGIHLSGNRTMANAHSVYAVNSIYHDNGSNSWGEPVSTTAGARTTGAIQTETRDQMIRVTKFGRIHFGTSDADQPALTNETGMAYRDFSGELQISSVNAAPLVLGRDGATGSALARFRNAGALVPGLIGHDGGGGIVYSTGSDRSLKENFEPVTGALELIAAMNPQTFTMKATGQRQIGFVAQDVQPVADWAVSEDPETGVLSLDYGRLVGVLGAAVMELSDKLEKLKDG